MFSTSLYNIDGAHVGRSLAAIMPTNTDTADFTYSISNDIQPRRSSLRPAPPAPPKNRRISNSKVIVGVDLARGGAINYIASAKDKQNVINTYDAGRYIQQSWYGEEDKSNWNGTPWRWNPVQGGSWDNQPARLESCTLSNTNQLTIETTPRNWAGLQLLEDVKMKTIITLLADGKVKLNCSMTYSGNKKHPIRHQEAPACFFHERYSKLLYKKQSNPKKILEMTPGRVDQSKGNTIKEAVASWVGYLDPATGKGVYVYSPQATILAAYRHIPNDPTRPAANCSYVAPVIKRAIVGPTTVSYEATIELKEKVGRM